MSNLPYPEANLAVRVSRALHPVIQIFTSFPAPPGNVR